VLTRLRREFPQLAEMRSVDVLRHPRTAMRAGIIMIPTLELNGRRLTGILPGEEEIRTFLREGFPPAPAPEP